MKKLLLLCSLLHLHLCAMKIELLDHEDKEDCIELLSPDVEASNTNDKHGLNKKNVVLNEEAFHLVNLHRRAASLINMPRPDDKEFSSFLKKHPTEMKRFTKDIAYVNSFGQRRVMRSLYTFIQQQKAQLNPWKNYGAMSVLWLLILLNIATADSIGHGYGIELNYIFAFAMISTIADIVYKIGCKKHKFFFPFSGFSHISTLRSTGFEALKWQKHGGDLDKKSPYKPKVLPWNNTTQHLLRLNTQIVDHIEFKSVEEMKKILNKNTRAVYELLLRDEVKYCNSIGQQRSFTPFLTYHAYRPLKSSSFLWGLPFWYAGGCVVAIFLATQEINEINLMIITPGIFAFTNGFFAVFPKYEERLVHKKLDTISRKLQKISS